jgi:hypothetical protein
MGTGWDLHVVPTDPAYRPSALEMQRAAKVLGLKTRAVGRLLAAVPSPDRDAAVRSAFGRSARLFGWDSKKDDPDRHFWCERLEVRVTAAPFPYADWEFESARCPACRYDMTQRILNRIEEGRDFGPPMCCRCKVFTALEKLRFSKRVRVARFSVSFLGNKGWLRHAKEDREAFKDPAFLPGLAGALATTLDVVAVSH